MKAVHLHPYPRIHSVEWSQTRVMVNGRSVEPEDLTNHWDSDSTISLSVSAAAPSEDLAKFGKPQLVLNAACSETAESVTSRGLFTVGSTRSQATTTIELEGSRLAEQLELRVMLTAPYGDEAWLSRRIIAERRAEHLDLQSGLRGFPTTAMSFKAANRRQSPWLLSVSATELSDPFAHSIQLVLNEDYPRIEELIEGQAQPHVETSLNAAIIRSLVQTARRLADDSDDDANLEAAVLEFPHSIAAAADKASRDFLKRPITWVVSSLRSHPEDVEAMIDSAVGALKEKR